MHAALSIVLYRPKLLVMSKIIVELHARQLIQTDKFAYDGIFTPSFSNIVFL